MNLPWNPRPDGWVENNECHCLCHSLNVPVGSEHCVMCKKV